MLHAAIFALLDASIPLRAIAACVVVATPSEALGREPITTPSPDIMSKAKSLHLLGFTSNGSLLLAESEGEFTLNEWDAAVFAAHSMCCRQIQGLVHERKRHVKTLGQLAPIR